MQRLKNEILSQIDYARKNQNQILSNSDKKEQFLSSFDVVFDIALCGCFRNKPACDFIQTDCMCPDEKKIINFEGYKSFMHDKNARILLSEDEKIRFEDILLGNLYNTDWSLYIHFWMYDRDRYSHQKYKTLP